MEIFYFISDKFLCSYNGKTFNKIKLLEHKITSFEFCGIADGCYLIQYYAEDEYRLRGLDLNKNLPFYTMVAHCFSKYQGIGINTSYEMAIFQDQINAGHFANYQSLKFNMGSGKKKRITDIEAFSYGSIRLNIRGDFGMETVYVEGGTAQKLNLVSKDFYIQFSCLIGNLPLSDVKIKYQILGE